MRLSRSSYVFLFLSLGLSACGEKPRPVEGAPRPTASAELAPLSSRDGGSSAVPPAAAEGSASELPPGHPPIESHPLQKRPAAAEEGGSVSGSIDVAAPHRAKIKGGALFVIARRAGTREVVAVRKEERLELPQKFFLSSSDVMMEGVSFAGPFDVTVRWSQSGDAMPAPGDIEGTARNVALGASNVAITLSDVRP
jgi:hypothetical protein